MGVEGIMNSLKMQEKIWLLNQGSEARPDPTLNVAIKKNKLNYKIVIFFQSSTMNLVFFPYCRPRIFF